MSKVTCSICKNEEGKICRAKKIGVHINKRRDCNKFILAEDKVGPVHLVKTIKMPYAEKEEMKRRYKEELKHRREIEKNTKEAGLDPASINMHPLTGDLSRFTSTAAKE
jgi:hypothetical protein